MALSEPELKRCEKAVEQFLGRRRPAANMRNQIDIDCRLSGHSVEIVEIRPNWRDPTKGWRWVETKSWRQDFVSMAILIQAPRSAASPT